MHKIHLFFILVLLISGLFSCEDESSTFEPKDLSNIEYVENNLSTEDKLKAEFSKILSNALSNNDELKKLLIDKVIDQSKSQSTEVFVLDLLSEQEVSLRNTTFRDYLLAYGDVTQSSLSLLESSIASSYPNMVIDVPAPVEMVAFSPSTQQSFISSYLNYPYVIVPNTHTLNANGKWTGYLDQNVNGTNILEIPVGGSYQGVIPFIVKTSERALLLTNNETLINGENVVESYFGKGFATETLACLQAIISDGLTPKVLGGVQYQVLSIYTITDADTEDCFPAPPPPPDEICDNGIDDDGDGLIDGADPDCIGEICDDGIDNDGDGLIDSADPDCNPNNVEICCDGIDNDGDGLIDEADSDCCYRDCRSDNNFLIDHGFDNLPTALATVNAQVPGGERITQLKYQITTLEKSCDTCTPSAVHHNQIVVANTYRLICDASRPWPFLLPDELVEDCVSGGTYQHSIQRPAFIAGATYLGSVNQSDFPGSVIFEVGNWSVVLTPAMSVVKKKMLYLRSERDWDGSVIANELKMTIYEIDEVESSSTSSSSNTITRTHTVNAMFGIPFKVFGVGLDGLSYNYASSQSQSASLEYEVKAKDIYELGDLSLFYCDDEAPATRSIIFPHVRDYYEVDVDINDIDDRNTSLRWFDVIENTYE